LHGDGTISDQAQFIVLCEDLQSKVFIRRALMKRGADSRRIRFEPLPSSGDKGAADAYVIKKYPGQVKAFRARNSRTSTSCTLMPIQLKPSPKGTHSSPRH
jgi:hypothetical protein